jgi:uncharacterized membrane protein YeaQ/YmgE (transglycosylase-associated protein family)
VKIGIDIIHETKNLVISSIAMVLTVFIFKVALLTDVLYQLVRLVDKIHIQQGLIPKHILNMLIGGPYSIVSKIAFVILSFVFGFFAFKLINKRGTKCPCWFYGIFMTIIFFLIGLLFSLVFLQHFLFKVFWQPFC